MNARGGDPTPPDERKLRSTAIRIMDRKGASPMDGPGEQDMLRLHLTERDTPCPGCGYNLRGLAGSVCPECAQEVRLAVALSEPRLGPYLGAVIGVSMAAAPPTVLLAAVAYISLTDNGTPSGPEVWPFVWWPMIFAAVGWVLLGELVGRKGRIRFLKLRRPWGAAGLAWALAIVPFIVWFWSLLNH
jgi:hypothetical protein